MSSGGLSSNVYYVLLLLGSLHFKADHKNVIGYNKAEKGFHRVQ